MNDTVKERIRKAKDENSTVLDLGHCNLETIPDEIFEQCEVIREKWYDPTQDKSIFTLLIKNVLIGSRA